MGPIAIVGRACVLPGAHSPAALWEAVAAGRDLLSEVPPDRWGADPDTVVGQGPDRAWSTRGGYVTGFQPDLAGFAVPAAELAALDPLFHLALHTAREALADAGATGGPRVGAILGNLSFPTAGLARFAESVWLGSLAPSPGDPRDRFMSGMPSLLLRRALELGGPTFSLDAACASSLYAIKLAGQALDDGRADLMLAGGVNRCDDLFIHVGFSALAALSRSGRSRPFHAEADGLVPAEGAAMVALMRLADAEAQGRPILGVIRGIGLSNDGRGRNFLAPSEHGQVRALRAAYAEAGLDPREVGLLECHATGTPVGDATEIASTARVFAEVRDLPVGSLKGNLGHLVTAAGAAGLVKVLEAMAHRLRPPTLHADLPSPALEGTPLRPLRAAEPWEGPLVGAVSAFGFGGNNAHLVVEAPRPGPAWAAPAFEAVPVAIVGLGAQVADTVGARAFARALAEGESRVAPLADGSPAAPATAVTLPLAGLRFPPRDLERSLAQQLAVLAAALEATAGVGALPRERTAVMVGMGTDPEIARYGARWRAATWNRRPGSPAVPPDAFAPELEAAAVLGTMPNIPANRVNSQLDLAGPSFTLAAEELSGLRALDLAVRGLRSGELDAALVGAVDFSVEPVHRAAAAALLGAEHQVPGDAAVVLVLKRLSQAERDGDRVLAVVEEGGAAPAVPELAPRFGHAHAASGLLRLAAGALALHHRVRVDGGPFLAEGPRRLAVKVRSFSGDTWRGGLAEHPPTPAGPLLPAPRLHVYGGRDREAVLAALEAGAESPEGPARLVLVASSEEELDRRRARARAHLAQGAPAGRGVIFRSRPLAGDLALVFTGAGAAYRGMGRELFCAFPELVDQLARRVPGLPRFLDWAGREPGVLDKLWGSSALCQVHAALSRQVLGLEPDAVIGYSSGETNALLATGAWTDLAALVEDARTSGLFDRELGGAFAAVERAWGQPVDWALWTVLAPLDEVREAISVEPRVHLAIVHTDTDCVIAGDAAGCARAVERLGSHRCHRLAYDLAAHVPEVREVEAAWRALHLRRTRAPRARVYSGAWQRAYPPSAEGCADAITAQAVDTLDFRRTVEQAWRDGVRVFVEHGPQGACTRWIRQVLGDREHLSVSLDRRQGGLAHLVDSVAHLVAAGVKVDHEALMARLGPVEAPAGPTLRFPAHLPPVVVERPPLAEPLQPMAPAPALPSVSVDPPEAVASPPSAAAPAPAGVAARWQAHLAQLGAVHRDFLAQQAQVHEQFLALRERAQATLLQAMHGTPLAPRPAAAPAPRPAFDRIQLETHASGRISALFGPAFAGQDGFPRQVRMPEPPLLLADRITFLEAVPRSMGTGRLGSETDVPPDAWYLHDGHMPAGIMIESGQADLLLISYLGIDFFNRGERVYRLLGCKLAWHGDLPAPGETLCYEIHADGHAKHGDVRLFFFHYDCRVGDRPRLTVREGQAGFFTDEELARSEGILWTPEAAEPCANPRLDPPVVATARTALGQQQLRAFSEGRLWEAFGPGFERAKTHTRTPRVQGGRMLLLERVDTIAHRGGPWGRGYLRATTTVHPDDWYFAGHFKGDPCMPGTLMFEGCLQAMAVLMASQGFTLQRDGWRFQPVQDEVVDLKCRGQVIPSSRELVYEVFVEEVTAGPVPTLYADLLCTCDGLKAFHARRMGLQLVPAWPLDTLEVAPDPKPVATTPEGFAFGQRSLLACAWGRPSEAFGPSYARFDGPRHVARLPGPPYHFMSRILRVEGEQGRLQPGARVLLEYDVPPDAWYFAEGGGQMPFAVLLEAALQPCGWLASYAGSTLVGDEDLYFRNLDGAGTVHGPVRPGDGVLRTEVALTRVSRSAGMIIESFAVRCFAGERIVYALEPVFGFFPAEALRDQVGLPPLLADALTAPSAAPVDPTRPPRAGTGRLALLQRVTGLWPRGGVAGLGRIRVEMDVDPGQWFFQAHFMGDPVQPGSIGLQAMIQALELLADATAPGAGRFEAPAAGVAHAWRYRGQVLPEDERVTIVMDLAEAHPGDGGPLYLGQGSLWVDGKRIYEATGLGVRRVERQRASPG